MSYNTLSFAHDFIRRYVKQGDFCIDATAGRGRDTALLCSLVGTSGNVLAFDIQQSAVAQTEQLLHAQNLHAQVILDSHANMERYAAPESVDCIVFNFGRLPGGDPDIFTTEQSSIKAIAAGLRLLKSGGIMSLSIYYGGANGYAERDAILQYLRTIDDRKYSVLVGDWANRTGDPPIPVFLWKE
ncbi:MAG: class I SAM-dependent methyltransferase [Butyricicoccus pullicaecorum]|nr:class I SAM-dependent methyltransferase [Butyricicoccus pullicaecorum]